MLFAFVTFHRRVWLFCQRLPVTFSSFSYSQPAELSDALSSQFSAYGRCKQQLSDYKLEYLKFPFCLMEIPNVGPSYLLFNILIHIFTRYFVYKTDLGLQDCKPILTRKYLETSLIRYFLLSFSRAWLLDRSWQIAFAALAVPYYAIVCRLCIHPSNLD